VPTHAGGERFDDAWLAEQANPQTRLMEATQDGYRTNALWIDLHPFEIKTIKFCLLNSWGAPR